MIVELLSDRLVDKAAHDEHPIGRQYFCIHIKSGKKDHERHKNGVSKDLSSDWGKTDGNKIKDLSEFHVLPRAKTDNILFIEG